MSIAKAMEGLSNCLLYTFIDTAYLKGRDPVEVAKMLCDGGADVIQVRAKGLAQEEIRRIAERVRPVTEEAGVKLVVNDHFTVAVEVGADYCHLGQEDFFDNGFRYKADLINFYDGRYNRTQLVRVGLGLSSHSETQALRAQSAGADYVAVGPVFATPTKPGRLAVGLDLVRWAAANLKVPWFAIGGITLERLDLVLAAGARRVCVVSAILLAEDVRKTCLEFKTRLEKASQ